MISKGNLLKEQDQSILTYGMSCRRSARMKKEHSEVASRDGLLGRNREIT